MVYPGGGKLEIGESLTDCIVREVFEETGLEVKTGRLVHVFEFYDISERSHKVECYFLVSIVKSNLSLDWKDTGERLNLDVFSH